MESAAEWSGLFRQFTSIGKKDVFSEHGSHGTRVPRGHGGMVAPSHPARLGREPGGLLADLYVGGLVVRQRGDDVGLPDASGLQGLRLRRDAPDKRHVVPAICVRPVTRGSCSMTVTW
jgi:hypothetical protein